MKRERDRQTDKQTDRQTDITNHTYTDIIVHIIMQSVNACRGSSSSQVH